MVGIYKIIESVHSKIAVLLAKSLTHFFFPKNVKNKVRNKLIKIFSFSLIDWIKFKRQNFIIVSLGCSCLPRVITTAMKLKTRKMYGELSCPFDNNMHKDIDKINLFIQNGFKNYFESIKFDYEENCWKNDLNSIVYLHDRKNDIEIFTKRYTNRIKNFISFYEDKRKVFYILHSFSKIDIEKINILYYLLKNKRNGPFELIVISHEAYECLDSNIKQINCEWEISKDWVWEMFNINKLSDNNSTKIFYNEVSKKLQELIK